MLPWWPARPPAQTLLDIKGVSDVKVEKMREAARKIVPSGFTTALSALALVANRVRITTGSKALDAVVRAAPGRTADVVAREPRAPVVVVISYH